MSDVIIVAVLSLVGTLVGSIAGILTANKLTNYRIDQLEKKVEKHNDLVERMTIQEQNTKAIWRRIDEIREDLKEQEQDG